MKTLQRSNYSTNSSLESSVANCVSELMNAATSFHKLHLKTPSYAAHKALNEIYDALPEHADNLAEGFQGASEKLLEYTECTPRILNSIQDVILYLKDLSTMINSLQTSLPYSEIINELDNVKSSINSVKYKLIFLK